MNTSKFKNAYRIARRSVTKHSPEILTGFAVAGMISTVGLAITATPKAVQLIEQSKEETGVEKLPPVEVVKTTWRCYVPMALSGVFTIGCMVGATSVSVKRNAALAAACKLSEVAFSEYRDKVVETVGEKKEKTVRENIVKDHVESRSFEPIDIIDTGKGKTLFLDPLSDRPFLSDRDAIIKAENEINRQMLHDISGYSSLNDWYDELGLRHTDVGKILGWNTYNLMEIDFVPALAPNGEPCLELYYTNRPKYEFDRI